MLLVVSAAIALVLAGSGTGPDGGASSSVSIAEPAPAPARALPPVAGEMSDREAGEPAQGVPVGSVLRSFVRTAQISVELADPAAGIGEVRAAAVAAGGFVAEEQSGRDGAWLVLRVPAEALDRVVERVAAMGTVVDRGSTVVDATEEVVDLDAQVASLRASVARVRALLAEATSIGDVVAVESELARREAELDSLTGRLTALRDRVAMSTLTVNLQAPGGGVEPGFLAGLRAGWGGLRALGAAVGFALPFLPVLGALGGLGWLGWLGWRRRRVR